MHHFFSQVLVSNSCFLALEEDWIFDAALTSYLPRIKIVVEGTKPSQYLDGDYEGKVGRVVAAQRAPDGHDQTARIKFFDPDEERSILVKYITPQEPKYNDEDILVLRGEQRGMVSVVREKPELDMVTVSSRQNPVVFHSISKKDMVALTEENGR